MQHRLVPALLLPPTLVLTACGDDTPATTPRPASASPTPTITTSPTTPVHMRLGQTRTVNDDGTSATITAYSVKTLASQYPPDRKGYRYTGVDARVCMTNLGSYPHATVSWRPWSIQMNDESAIEPASSWSEGHFQVPLFPPTGRKVYACGDGSCSKRRREQR